MARQVINVGAAANDGTGDGLRTAYIKCNDNFQELYDTTLAPVAIANGTSNVSIPVSDGNVEVAINGTANVVVISSIATTIDSNLIVTGDVTGSANIQANDLIATDQITVQGTVASNLIPDGNGTRNLGSATSRWANLFLTGSTLTLGNLVIKDTSGNLGVFQSDGTTPATIEGSLNTSGGNIEAGNVISTGIVTATGNVTGGNIVTAGDVNADGNVSAGSGKFLIGDGGLISNVTVVSNVAVSQISNGTSILSIAGSGGNIDAQVGGSGILTLTTSGADFTGAITATTTVSATGNTSGGNLTTGGQVSATGNITGGNLTTAGNVTGNYFLGNGSQLTGLSTNSISNGTSNVVITAANSTVSINVGGSEKAAFNTGGANITGNANVSSAVTATGNVTGGNLITSGLVSAGTTITATGNISGGNISTGGLISATSTITATGNVSGGNLTTGGVVSATGNVNGGNLTTGGAVSATGNVSGAAITGTSINVNTGSITGNGRPIFSINAGNLNSGTVPDARINSSSITQHQGNITGTGNLNSGNITSGFGSIDNGSSTITTTGNISGGNVISSALVSATTITASGNISGGNLSVSTGSVTLGSVVNANSDGVGNIGASGAGFNTVFAKATSAQYADLAELYTSNEYYEPGTVVCFGGNTEVSLCSTDSDPKVAGVVSTNPAFIMNSQQEGTCVAVALSGRVPTKVVGPVCKGDMMVSAGNGQARSESAPSIGTVLGKSLQDFDGESGIIEIVVGRI